MKNLILQYGGFSVLFFLIALPFQIRQNFAQKKFGGSRATWTSFCRGYYGFTVYAFAYGDILVAVEQLIGGIMCSVILTQSFIYNRK